MPTDGDRSEPLAAAVAAASETDRSLTIVGSGSKSGTPNGSETVSTAGHEGVVDYRPDELVVVARAGSPLNDIESVLADAGQALPFEPPQFGGRGTLGGAVAAGLSGPGRPWFGSARDAILGVTIVNGMGQRLAFGGQVLKNVAGYDVSRLMAGAFGTLGLLLDVSLRVRPLPETSLTLARECTPDTAHGLTCDLLRQPLPVTATAYCGGVLRIRLSGSPEAVSHAAAGLDLDLEVEDEVFFQGVRDHTHPFFSGFHGSTPPPTGGTPTLSHASDAGADSPAEGSGRLWMLSLPLGSIFDEANTLTEWAGARVWWRTDADADTVQTRARVAGGYAASFPPRLDDVAPAVRKYMGRLKAAFDPAGILNTELLPHAD